MVEEILNIYRDISPLTFNATDKCSLEKKLITCNCK